MSPASRTHEPTWKVTCTLCAWSTTCVTEAGAAILRASHEQAWHLGRDVVQIVAVTR
ncbi:MAG: hypothetical protein WAL50_16285 [Kineosporiaceae bacterium]